MAKGRGKGGAGKGFGSLFSRLQQGKKRPVTKPRVIKFTPPAKMREMNRRLEQIEKKENQFELLWGSLQRERARGRMQNMGKVVGLAIFVLEKKAEAHGLRADFFRWCLLNKDLLAEQTTVKTLHSAIAKEQKRIKDALGEADEWRRRSQIKLSGSND